MKRVFDSLAVRLALLISAIVVAAVFGVARVYESAIKAEFVEFVALDDDAAARSEAQAATIARSLEAAYARDGWVGIEAAVAADGAPRAAVFSPAGELRASNLPADAEVRLAAADDGARFEMLRPAPDGRGETRLMLGVRPQPLNAPDGTPLGGLVLLPPDGGRSPATAFASSVSAQAAGFVAAVLGATLAAVFVFVRLVLRPITALTRAAHALRQRRRPQPVAASGALRELAEIFDVAAREILDRDELRRRFVADVAHELRTPVTNLKGRLAGVRAGLIDPGEAFQADLGAEIGHLERLIDDLQDLAAGDAGRLAVDPRDVALRVEVAAAFAAAFPAAGAALDNRVDDAVRVRADPARLRQILLNLFDNARRHARGGLTLTVEAAPRAEMVDVRVRDDGVGIPPGALGRVFERFYRGDRARGRATGGAGLGLAIVRSLVEAHGGEAWAEPAADGACLAFSLPRGGS